MTATLCIVALVQAYCGVQCMRSSGRGYFLNPSDLSKLGFVMAASSLAIMAVALWGVK